MGYKKNTFDNRKIYALSITGVFAVCAVIGGALLNNKSEKPENVTSYMASLNDDRDDNDYERDYESETLLEGKVNKEATVEGETKDQKEAKVEDEMKDQKEATVEGEMKDQKEVTVEGEMNNKKEADAENEVKTSNVSEAGAVGEGIIGLTFSKNSSMLWPVDGNIIIDYDMDNVVYFPTLDMYKCSDSLYIQAEEGTPVYASANGTVTELGTDSKLGGYVKMNLGNGYEVVYGGMKDMQVSNGLTVSKGDLVGYVSAPTKYYSLEGSNISIKLSENGNPIDPTDFLSYE